MSAVQLTDGAYLDIAVRLIASLVVGGCIGFERTFHGRPAGFRTHTLVCLSTSLLMLVTVFETRWFPSLSEGRVSLDPTRMAQGIMTGIGFLGAGTIIKDGLSVRGLTTAASIWITAAIGILVGIGFYFPAMIATVLTLGTLSLFRWLESRMPAQYFANLLVRFQRNESMSDAEIVRLLKDHNFTIGNLTYRLDAASDSCEYQMAIRSNRSENASRLADSLKRLGAVREFQISPTGD
jgi:putative Mg2+ transporter-C (MgtC) family protein